VELSVFLGKILKEGLFLVVSGLEEWIIWVKCNELRGHQSAVGQAA